MDKYLQKRIIGINRLLFLLLFLINGSVLAQPDNGWVHAFDKQDQQDISRLVNKLEYLEQNTDSLNNPLNTKILLKYNIAKIYSYYLIGTKPSVKSITNYKASLEKNTTDFFNNYKKLKSFSPVIQNSSSNNNKYLQETDSIANSTISNAKQFFTLLSISGNIKSIQKQYEPNIANPSSITSFDIETLLLAWNNYLNPKESNFDQALVEIPTKASATTKENLYTETLSVKTEEPITSPSTISRSQEINTTATLSEKREYPIINAGSLVFRVQIAAGKNNLSDELLSSIYKGTREIKKFKEEGWHKYYIAEVPQLKEAKQIKEESGVSDAFIMAYSGKTKITNYLDYIKQSSIQVLDAQYNNLAFLSKNKTLVVVQIAADKKPLTKAKLDKLYQGNIPINYIQEEGWHKYSIGSYKNFWPANKIRKKCGTPNAFIVAYKNGQKVDLWLKKTKNNK